MLDLTDENGHKIGSIPSPSYTISLPPNTTWDNGIPNIFGEESMSHSAKEMASLVTINSNKAETTVDEKASRHTLVNNPPHYNKHPSGIECIQITRHMNFNLGNAIKYIWRADLKNDAIEDLKKAAWYIQDEIQRREKQVK